MRKITREAILAFNNSYNFKRDNTKVCVLDDRVVLKLHGHHIATKFRASNELFISACGWLSNTTKERLNGLSGVSIYQADFTWYLNGAPWDGHYIKVV